MGERRVKFLAYVEPPEPMKGLEVPPEVVEALGGGKRPRVTITINGHSWKSRVAIMRGRSNVHGMTTAATIWVNAAIGMAAGLVVANELLEHHLQLAPVLTERCQERMTFVQRERLGLAIHQVPAGGTTGVHPARAERRGDPRRAYRRQLHDDR